MKLEQAIRRARRAAEWVRTWFPRRCAECEARSVGPFVRVRSWWDECERHFWRDSHLAAHLGGRERFVCMSCWLGEAGEEVRRQRSPNDVLGADLAVDWGDIIPTPTEILAPLRSRIPRD